MIYKITDSEMKENIFAVTLFIAIFSLVFGIRSYRLANPNPINFQEEIHLYLSENKSIDGLTEELSRLNVQFNKKNTIWLAKIWGWRSFKKGHYYLTGSYTTKDLLAKIGLGNEDPLLITVLPGQTREGFIRTLAAQINASEAEIENQLSDALYLQEIGLTSEQLFSRMLPETYSIYWSSSARAIVNRLLSHFSESVLKPFEDEIENSDYTLNEIMTLASIVELESSTEDEKPTISGLYINRLKRGMYLQADPTVAYAAGERRRLYFKDYELDHPYNTYKNKGLPPGPITNPKLSSIKAALMPKQHNYIYMVATPEGTHKFNSSFEQHKIDSDKYRRWLQEQVNIKEAETGETVLK